MRLRRLPRSRHQRQKQRYERQDKACHRLNRFIRICDGNPKAVERKNNQHHVDNCIRHFADGALLKRVLQKLKQDAEDGQQDQRPQQFPVSQHFMEQVGKQRFAPFLRRKVLFSFDKFKQASFLTFGKVSPYSVKMLFQNSPTRSSSKPSACSLAMASADSSAAVSPAGSASFGEACTLCAPKHTIPMTKSQNRKRFTQEILLSD